MERTCANPNCRKDFKPSSEDDYYCSRKCELEHEGIATEEIRKRDR